MTSSMPALALVAEKSPSEATIRAVESGLTAHATGLGLKTDWSPRWIIGRDAEAAVQAGIRFVLAFDWLFVNWLWVADPYRKHGIGSQLMGGAEAARASPRLSRRLSRHVHVSGAEVLPAARLPGIRPAR